MIVQCPACRALVDVNTATIDADGKRAGLSCRACDAVTWLGEGAQVVEGRGTPAVAQVPSAAEARSPADASTSAAPEPDKQPDAQPAAAATSTPGDVEALKAAIEAIDVPESEELKAAFIALLSTWDDEAAHKQVIQRGLLAGQLAVVGQGYRAVLDKRADDEMAAKGRDRVLGAAMTQLKELPRDDMSAGSGRKVVNAIAIVVCILVMGICGYYVFNIAMPQLADPERALEAPGPVTGDPVVPPSRQRGGNKVLPASR